MWKVRTSNQKGKEAPRASITKVKEEKGDTPPQERLQLSLSDQAVTKTVPEMVAQIADLPLHHSGRCGEKSEPEASIEAQ